MSHLRTTAATLRALCLAALTAALLPAPAMAQTAPTALDSAASDPQREVSVAPDVRDSEIADRLTRILTASGWFDALDVEVSEGIVFIDGTAENDERKEWARQLALRTEGVVAVVDRIEITPEISWDLTPTWREIERLAERAQWFAPLTFASILILALAWLLSRAVAALARRSLRSRITSPLLLNFVARVVSIPVILIALYLILQIAGLTRLAVTVLGGTGLVGIIVGLAFREIAENSLASILLSMRNPFRAGDWIRVADYQGIVQNLNMRTTILLTLEGNHVQIPNALVYKSIIENFSTNPNRRSEFTVGIGYDDSVLEAQEIIVAALRAHPAVLNDPEPSALVDELGASTVDIKVQYWFDGHAYSVFKVRSALMRQVKLGLQNAGISMPDSSREIIFPDGVTVRHEGADAAGDMRISAHPAPLLPEEDAADATAGEGDLASEAQDLQRQADAAPAPEEGANLLAEAPPK
ncbi:mechanosensitive ion channel family protein [Roseovarius nanhaiticus]|uniref:mechanosensitive ion channel family protein n=1 Tax=Roseovarius nanhaiticus TaxID=573024 RepID=UPI002492A331|nr:mechanosensitive ion channel family protein [Roseovarius nanhaiticus]